MLAGMRTVSVQLRGSPLLAALLPRAKAEGEDLRLRVLMVVCVAPRAGLWRTIKEASTL